MRVSICSFAGKMSLFVKWVTLLFIILFFISVCSEDCFFGNTLSPDVAMGSNNYLRYVTGNDNIQFDNIDQLVTFFCSDYTYNGTDIFRILCGSLNSALRDPATNLTGNLSNDGYQPAGSEFFAPRTCNQYWNPTVTISTTNVDSFYLGMASQRTEREDFIITPDLRGRVFGQLDYTRRDLMAQNLQRGRDHGLPDFNSARKAYALPPLYSFEDLNPLYGVEQDITDNIERLRDVYNNDLSR